MASLTKAKYCRGWKSEKKKKRKCSAGPVSAVFCIYKEREDTSSFKTSHQKKWEITQSLRCWCWVWTALTWFIEEDGDILVLVLQADTHTSVGCWCAFGSLAVKFWVRIENTDDLLLVSSHLSLKAHIDDEINLCLQPLPLIALAIPVTPHDSETSTTYNWKETGMSHWKVWQTKVGTFSQDNIPALRPYLHFKKHNTLQMLQSGAKTLEELGRLNVVEREKNCQHFRLGTCISTCLHVVCYWSRLRGLLAQKHIPALPVCVMGLHRQVFRWEDSRMCSKFLQNKRNIIVIQHRNRAFSPTHPCQPGFPSRLTPFASAWPASF